MNKQEVIQAWAEKSDRVFMYQRYQYETPEPCTVLGFQSKTERTDRWSPERTVTYVRVMRHGWRGDSQAYESLVLPRYLTFAHGVTIAEYWELKRAEEQQREEVKQHRADVKHELADLLKEVMPSQNVSVMHHNGRVTLSYDLVERLCGVLKDARLFYTMLADGRITLTSDDVKEVC